MDFSELPLGQVIEADCIDALKSFPEESIDLIFADPPYNLQLQQDLLRPNMTRVDAVDDAWDRFDSFTAYDNFSRAWLSACRRVLKPGGTIWIIGTYHNIFRVGKILQDLDYWILNDIAWVKTNPMPNFRGVRFTNAQETLIWAQKSSQARYTFNYQAMKALNGDLQMRSDWHLPICTGSERLKVNGAKAHTTQKPEALLYRVILSSSHPGDLVLDPFFGTGTTGAMAKRLHRRWIGIEKDPRYATIARERIASIPDEAYNPKIYDVRDRRSKPRVPFGRLVENGYLRPGQTLYFDKGDKVTAVIQANSKIISGDFTGSIHQVAKMLRRSSNNGWDCWFYYDEEAGERYPIDRLREKYRRECQLSIDSPGE